MSPGGPVPERLRCAGKHAGTSVAAAHRTGFKGMRLDLELVIDGMALSESQLDDRDRVLLPRGTMLTKTVLSFLRRSGAKTLSVERASGPWLGEAAGEQQRYLRMSRLFRNRGDGPGDDLLRTAVLHSLSEK